MIPLVDLSIQHREIAEEVQAGWASVLEGTEFILGRDVEKFEAAFAAFTGVPECVGVASGTDAIELALRACGVGAGHEVVLPTNSFVATALAAVRAGATPVLVDVDPNTHLIDVSGVVARIGSRTKAIIPVHLYGQLAPVEDLLPHAEAVGAVVVEDAAQCAGAHRHGAHAGQSGAIAALSFYPAKNLGAYGDAGAVLTRSGELASRVRSLRNYGSENKYEHSEVGFNSRLDTLQAVVLSAKLRRLAAWNEERRAAADRYDTLLATLPEVTRPVVLPGNEHVWHLYVVRVPRRDDVLSVLRGAGVGAGVHYPRPIHLQGAFLHLGYRPGDFPVAEELAETILSLPIYPGITAEQQEYVVQALGRALSA
jgi:dTDP-4-amino-4,6-dideoxygalactose transaminase